VVSQAEGDMCRDMSTSITQNKRISSMLSLTSTTVTPSQRCPSTEPQKSSMPALMCGAVKDQPFVTTLGFLAISSTLPPPTVPDLLAEGDTSGWRIRGARIGNAHARARSAKIIGISPL
jgi:hypothetical protein